MKVRQVINEYLDYEGFGKCASICGLEIIEIDGKYKVILTELPNNRGTSVTNTVATIATQVFNVYLKSKVNIEDIEWVEHYPASKSFAETFDIVMFDYNGVIFSNPKWKRLGDTCCD